MNEQQDFIKRINECVELAIDQENVIFEDQLFLIFPEAKEDKAKFEVLKQFLDDKKIGLNEKLSIDKLITKEEKNYLDIYLEELKEKDPLSQGEREAYMLSAMGGDEDAQMIIVNDSLMQVVEIAKLYAGQGVFMEDLIGEGNLALMTSISHMESATNASEGENLLAEAIMGAMENLVADTVEAAGAEEKLLDKVNKVASAAKELSDTLGRKVSVAELSLESGLTEAAIIKALKLTANMIENIEIPEELK